MFEVLKNVEEKKLRYEYVWTGVRFALIRFQRLTHWLTKIMYKKADVLSILRFSKHKLLTQDRFMALFELKVIFIGKQQCVLNNFHGCR